MQFKKISFLLFSSILFFAACDSKNTKNQSNSIQNTISKENFNLNIDLHTTNNETINVKISKNKIEFEGINDKIVLINFFATWCPPCKAEIPHLNALVKKYPNDFEVISILLEKNRTNKDINEFIKEFKILYKITNSSSNYQLEQAVGEVKSIPTMFLLNKQGEIKQKYVGIVLEEMLEIDIKKILNN